MKSKGFTVKGALAFVEKRYGPAGRERLIESLVPEHREICSRRILSTDWVPFTTQVALYEAIDRMFGRGDFALCEEVGRFTSELEMSTINMIFLKLGKLEHWFRVASMMWGRYYTEGKLDVGGFSPGTGTVTIRDFDPLSKAFCRDFSGWLARTIELSGCRDVTVEHSQCMREGAPECRFVGRWKEK